jgi:glutathione S-transferase
LPPLNKWLLFTVTELEQPLWRIAKNEFLYSGSPDDFT